MSYILSMVMQEKKHIEYMLDKYQKECNMLPKGSIYEKKSGEKIYYYLKYREGNKVISRYVDKSKIDDVRSQVEKRKHVEAMIKYLQNELIIANRVLGGEV